MKALRTGYPADRAYKMHYRRALMLSKLRRCPHCIYNAAAKAIAGAGDDKEVPLEMTKIQAKVINKDEKLCESKKSQEDFCSLTQMGKRMQLMSTTLTSLQQTKLAAAISSLITLGNALRSLFWRNLLHLPWQACLRVDSDDITPP